MRSQEGAEKSELDDLRPSLRNLYAVVPLGYNDYSEKPHIWDISQFCFQKMLNDDVEEDEERESFPDLGEGWTLRARFSDESYAGNSFAKIIRIDFLPRDKQYGEKYIKNVPDLDKCLTIMDYDRLYNFFHDLENEEEPEEGVEEDPEPEDEPKDEPIHDAEKNKGGKSKKDDDEDLPESFEEIQDLSRKNKKRLKRRLEKKGYKVFDDTDESLAEALDIEVPPSEDGDDGGDEGGEDNECPAGLRFGVDTDQYKECEDCPQETWDRCMDAAED
jgi:hypothetical protein